MGKDQAEREEYRVVKEGLGHHQRQRQDTPLSVLADHRCQDQPDTEYLLGMDLDAFVRHRRMLPCGLCDVLLDVAYRLFGKLVLAMRHQPPGAFWHESTEQQDAEAQDGADAETKSPAYVRGEQVPVEQEWNGERSCRCAEPEAAVDDEVDTATIFRRNELIDRGIDRGVLPTDAETGDHPENGEA